MVGLPVLGEQAMDARAPGSDGGGSAATRTAPAVAAGMVSRATSDPRMSRERLPQPSMVNTRSRVDGRSVPPAPAGSGHVPNER